MMGLAASHLAPPPPRPRSKMCLRNRHGEDCDAAAASGKWVCPQCRGSCGKGCVSCCNCGPCRKKLELEPTRQVSGDVLCVF